MPLIQWSKDLSVNVAEIDSQHQKLIQMINDLNDAMAQGKGKDVIGKTIDGLVGYTDTHFTFEEKYFEKFGYADTYRHRMEHVDFMKNVSVFKKDHQSGNVSLSIDVMNFLSDWLKKHIMVSDKKYGPFFNQKGLK
jgi:hemerythrin